MFQLLLGEHKDQYELEVHIAEKELRKLTQSGGKTCKLSQPHHNWTMDQSSCAMLFKEITQKKLKGFLFTARFYNMVVRHKA